MKSSSPYVGGYVAKTKLTLSVDESVIKRAKRFSRRNQTTVSELVSRFLSSLGEHEDEAAPITSRLRGVLSSDASVEEYHEHLESKYQ
jgi:hypothetical protein